MSFPPLSEMMVTECPCNHFGMYVAADAEFETNIFTEDSLLEFLFDVDYMAKSIGLP
jgi:hypothetical protein